METQCTQKCFIVYFPVILKNGLTPLLLTLKTPDEFVAKYHGVTRVLQAENARLLIGAHADPNLSEQVCWVIHPYSQIELLSQFLSDQCNSVHVFLSSYHCLHVHDFSSHHSKTDYSGGLCCTLASVLPDNDDSYTYTSNW